jgi:hypothetical protein
MSHATLVAGLMASLITTPATDPGRVTETSPFGPQPVKSVTATCSDGWVRYAGGGAVDYGPAGGGGVALTGVIPDADGHSITVTAAAAPGRPGGWALTAVAICAQSVEPRRIAEHGTGTVTAECPGESRLFGLGFRAENSRVTEVAMDAGLSRVRVTASGPAEVSAIALCRPPAADMRRVRVTESHAGWPITASDQESDPEARTYATGASVSGPPAAALDAIVPGPDDGTSWARATLVGVPGMQRNDDEDDDGSVTLDSGRIGTFH